VNNYLRERRREEGLCCWMLAEEPDSSKPSFSTCEGRRGKENMNIDHKQRKRFYTNFTHISSLSEEYPVFGDGGGAARDDLVVVLEHLCPR
jgi:hypothetical protein